MAKYRPDRINPESPSYRQLMQIIKETCEKGEVLPAQRDIATMLGVTDRHVGECMRSAEARGLIEVRGRNGGRRIIWRETGKSTSARGINPAPTIRRGNEAGSKKLEAAKQFLRRFFPNVYDAHIVGGPKGHVEVQGVGRLTEAQTIALAEQKGWVA